MSIKQASGPLDDAKLRDPSVTPITAIAMRNSPLRMCISSFRSRCIRRSVRPRFGQYDMRVAGRHQSRGSMTPCMKGSRAFALLFVVALAGVSAGKERVVRLTLGPFRIDPERDREVCQAVRIPNVPNMELASWEVRSRTSRHAKVDSHHMVVHGKWLLTAGTTPLGLATLLPNPGDAPTGALVVLNSHYINGSSRPARGL